MNQSLRLRAIAVAAFLFVNGMQLQAAAADDQLPEIKVTGAQEHGDHYAPTNASTALKIDAQQKDIPQTINVITSEVMRDQGARTLTDVLKNVPGIGLATGDGQRDAFVIRGFTALSDILLDGVRDDSQYFRDMYNIDRIEVLKGPAAVLYGRGSSGGVINRITKKPDLTGPSGEISATVGSDELKRTEFSLNRPISDTLAVRVDGALEDSGSYRKDGFLKNKDISPSLLWKDGNQSVLLQYDYQNQKRSIDFGVPGVNGRPVNVDPSTVYGAANANANDFTASVMQATTAQYNLRLSDKTSFSNKFRYFDYTLDRNHTRVIRTTGTAANPILNFQRGNIDRDEHGWFNQSELTNDVMWGSTRHQILTGLEFGEQNKYQYVNNALVANYYLTPLSNPVLPNLPFTVSTPPTTAGNNSVGTSILTTAGAYVQDLTSWNSQIKTLVGLRYDSYGQKYENQIGPNLKRTDTAFSPRVGIVWQPTNTQSYYASVSKSFQPSAEAGALATNNADLGPEKTQNLEVGTKLDLFNGAASFTAAVYQLTRSDVKVTNPSIPTQLIQIGEQQTKGVELSLGGEIARGWQLIGSYSYMDGEVTKAVGNVPTPPLAGATATLLKGKTLALTPKQTASLWTLKSIDQWIPGVQVGGGVTYRGANYAAIDNAIEIPAFTTVDLAAYYRPAPKGMSLALNLKNIFDRKYFISANNDVGILPGSPRSVELTARYSF
ncbi:MAG: TonB-dependent siderophore receptor [Herminiimonas sp.]|uniref:TonB-dependent receptor n=1 Tax=Herminiimonas sp. TaxID=1926289 RepID=UPI002721235A|nr:TonB-dependent siderophore receptor [Herminiimonas sp.]MDO9420232.1 TonB-dependent siderophore receptor [Herminiimonas sp.]